MNKYLKPQNLLFGAAAFLGFAVVLIFLMMKTPLDPTAEHTVLPPLRQAEVLIKTQTGASHSFQVEVAESVAAQARGLMFRQSLAQDSGMIFIFPKPQETRFWMKNTFIPLDILFIKADGTIHKIAQNAKPHDETQIPSDGEVKAVLEIVGGLSAQKGIKAGDRVVFEAVFE
jgi:hypothetical protein